MISVHLGQPRQAKPESQDIYSMLRKSMQSQPWQNVSEDTFVELVTQKGVPFYQCLFQHSDFLEVGSERNLWRLQTLVGLDFDQQDVAPSDMAYLFSLHGIPPWLGYFTFSHKADSQYPSYRLLWRTCIDLNLGYDSVSAALKRLRAFSFNRADKHALNPTRLWQGTRHGHFHRDDAAPLLDLRKLV